jgi:ABC-type branched-subunit amino acid transport system substrate-binding protein
MEVKMPGRKLQCSKYLASTTFLLLAIGMTPAVAEKKYGPGVSDTEIKIGNTMPYSGPASAVGAIGHTLTAYFKRLNERGGVNGRKIKFISLDDGFSPPKTMEQTRRLVEEEQVAFIFAPLGTASNSVTQKYLNANKVPQLFLISAASKWNDPKNFPWSMSLTWGPNYYHEARFHTRYLVREQPSAKIGVLYQNDDGGKDLLRGLRDEAAAQGVKISAEASFEVTDPTVDSQIVTLQASGADALFIYSITPKACAQAIRKAYDIGWRPMRFLFSGCLHPDAVLKPAGFDKANGIIATAAIKTVSPDTLSDPAVAEYLTFMKDYNPNGAAEDGYNIYAYALGKTVEEVLRRAGDDLTRENIMRISASLHDFRNPLYREGIMINTTPTDYATVREAYLVRFDGKNWVQFGELLTGR